MVDPLPTDSVPTTTIMNNTTTAPSETTKASTTAQTSSAVTTPADDSWMDDTGVWLVTGLLSHKIAVEFHLIIFEGLYGALFLFLLYVCVSTCCCKKFKQPEVLEVNNQNFDLMN